MALFKPNLDCLLRERTGTNVYGEETLGQAVKSRCSIIQLKIQSLKSSVRADSSATRGSAREVTAEGTLLFPTTSPVKLDDQVEVAGYKLRVVSVFPRHNLQGVFDHLEVEVTVWGST